jgi:hypothetical protein
MPGSTMVPAHYFNSRFHGFGTGITEERCVGKAVGYQTFGKLLLAWNHI